MAANDPALASSPHILDSSESILAKRETIVSARNTLGIETPETNPERFLARITTFPFFKTPIIAVSTEPGSEFLLAGYVKQPSNATTSRSLFLCLNGINWNCDQGAKAAAHCIATVLKRYRCTDAHAILFPLRNTDAFFQEATQSGLLPNLWNRQTQRLATLFKEGRQHPREQISSKRRLRLRKNESLLETMGKGPLRIETITSPAQVDEFMAAIDSIFPHTWQSEKGLGVHDTPAWRNTINLEAEAGKLYSHILYAGEHPIAYQFGTIYGNTFNWEVMGFDQRYAKASPGQILRIEMLSQLFERKIVGFEMGAGDYEFKQSWSDDSVEIANFQLCRKTIPGILKYLKRGLKSQAKSLRQRIRPQESQNTKIARKPNS